LTKQKKSEGPVPAEKGKKNYEFCSQKGKKEGDPVSKKEGRAPSIKGKEKGMTFLGKKGERRKGLSEKGGKKK